MNLKKVAMSGVIIGLISINSYAQLFVKYVDVDGTNGSKVVAPPDTNVSDNDDGSKVVKIKSSSLGEEYTSKTEINIDKDGLINTNITIESGYLFVYTVSKTDITAPAGTEVKVNIDGTIENSFNSTTIVADRVGKINAEVKSNDLKEIEIEIPDGSQTSIDSNSSINAVNNFESLDSTVTTKINAKKSGELIVEVKNNKDNNESSKLLPPPFAENIKASIEIEEPNANERTKRGQIKSGIAKITYSTRKSFLRKNGGFYRSNENDSLQITPKDSLATFEEELSFDNKRIIKLISGEAYILINGEKLEMEVGKSYELKPLGSEEELKELIIEDSYFTNLSNGWNLLGAGEELKVDNLKEFDIVWKYSNGQWYSKDEIDLINEKEGFWGRVTK